MYQPETYWIALLFMVASMLCWGSWASTMKLTPRYPFQLFYWDYVVGALATSLIWGFTLGNIHTGGNSFANDLRQADAIHTAYALLGGFLFNVANLLLVAAIDLAGLAVAFPVGIGLALVVGVLFNYLITPKGNPILLFGGVALVVLAIVLNAIAYRRREVLKKVLSMRGIQISVACGILMGISYPFIVKAINGVRSYGPYAVSFIFVVGIALCAVPVNYFIMRRPLTGGAPVDGSMYFKFPRHYHLWGILGGAIWCTGTVLNSRRRTHRSLGRRFPTPLVKGRPWFPQCGVYSCGKNLRMLGLRAQLILPMFLSFIVGLLAVAVAPILVK